MANAGLIFNFSNVSGTTVPKIVANITTAHSEQATEMVTAKFDGNIIRLYTRITPPSTVALSNPINTSLPSYEANCLISSEPLARP